MQQQINDAEALNHLAKIWGGVSGLTHRQGGQDRIIAPRLTPDLGKAIKTRAAAYLKQLRANFDEIASDPTAGPTAISPGRRLAGSLNVVSTRKCAPCRPFQRGYTENPKGRLAQLARVPA